MVVLVDVVLVAVAVLGGHTFKRKGFRRRGGGMHDNTPSSALSAHSPNPVLLASGRLHDFSVDGCMHRASKYNKRNATTSVVLVYIQRIVFKKRKLGLNSLHHMRSSSANSWSCILFSCGRKYWW